MVMVTMRKPYQIYNFKQNIDSIKLHQKYWKEKSHKDEEAKKRVEVRNNMTRYLLLCAKRPKTSEYLKERIRYDVVSQDAVLGDTSVENYLSKQVGEDSTNFSKSTSGKTLPNPPVQFT